MADHHRRLKQFVHNNNGLKTMVYRNVKSPVKKSGMPTFKRSVLAMAVMACTSQAYAQDEEETSFQIDEEVFVTGVRANLQNAQEIKRNADTFVDAISAEDIGSLPDRSVLEAMQRMPGVSVERFAGPDDPDHFSVEGSGAIIRGMTATRSEFNGRDSFTANSGRGLSFQDVSPELMGGVEVFKNQTADMIEGGIGGTINLKTRKPFDSQERVLAISGDYSYGDIAKEWTPTFSALFSDRWDIGVGEFGLLVNYANSELMGASHGIQSDAFVQYHARDLAGAEEFVDEFGEGTVWIPNASNLLMKTDDRKREGASAALQFQNTDETFLATFQYIRSEANLAWNERAIKYQGGYHDIDTRQTRPRTGTEFEFDDQGLFESGFITQGVNGWRVADPHADHVPRAWNGPGDFSQFGHATQMDSRVNETDTLVEDMSLNFQWAVNSQLDLEADLQYVQAETANDDLAIHANTWAAQQYDISGSTPTLGLVDPFFGQRDANPADYAEGWPGFSGDPEGDANYFQDPNSYYWRSAMDHYERSDGESAAVRLDGTYHFEDAGVFRSVKAGVRYANREQTVRSTNWNWGSTSPEWVGEEPLAWLADVESHQDAYELVDWSDFMGGDVADIPGDGTLHANEDFIRAVMVGTRDVPRTAGANWVAHSDQPNVDAEFGLFEPHEISSIEETNQAIYVRLDFEGQGDLRYSGNIGARYFKLNRKSSGFVSFPDLVPDEVAPDRMTLPLTPEAVYQDLQAQVDNGDFATVREAYEHESNRWITDRNNYLSDTERAFGNDASEVLEADEDFSALLPSFNIKLELTDDLIARFAIAKAVALPDIGDVRNTKSVGAREVAVVRIATDPEVEPTVEEQLIQGAFTTGWQGSGGNPYLKPMESTQYDISLEWYFSDVGQLSGTLFHKKLKDMFVQGSTFQELTNPTTGVTQVADITSTRNGGDGKMDGFELSYQQFFDMLPEPFDGFGLQATYTYIDADGSPNNETDVEDEAWLADAFQDTGIRVNLDRVPLQGQSDKTINLVAMYEKYDWSARLAYNWRSRYLLTTRDVISKAPLWYDDHGQLDASIFYNVTDNIEVGIQGTNITNSQSDTIMILNDEMLETGRSWFQADRRVALVFRAQF